MSDQIDKLLASWQKDKDNMPLTAELINALFASPDFKRSEEIFQQIPFEVRNRAEVYARHIEFLIYNKQFQPAVGEAKSLCEVTNNHHMSLHYWALTNFLCAQHQPIIELASNPKLLPETKIIVARVLHRQGTLEQAIALLADTKTAEGLGLLSLLNLDFGQFDLAFKHCEQALALKADQVDALQTKASLLVAENNMTAGAQVLNKVLKLKPNSSIALALKGQIEFFTQDIRTAIKTFEQTLKLAPEHIGSLHFLGWCYCIAGQFDVAEHTFEKSLKIEPDFAESQGALAVLAVVRGDFDGGGELADKVLTATPDCASASYAKALISEQNNDDVKPAEEAANNTSGQSFGERIISVVKQFKQ